VKALLEAESYDGPSLVIAYSHCIAHDIDIKRGLEQQRRAVLCGHWPLYRFDPRAVAEGRSPLTVDSKAPRMSFADYASGEGRYRQLQLLDDQGVSGLTDAAQRDVDNRWRLMERLAEISAHSRPAGSEN
jgi:pyruvate-ferredoxin/flavodoxin oxidoreductase